MDKNLRQFFAASRDFMKWKRWLACCSVPFVGRLFVCLSVCLSVCSHSTGYSSRVIFTKLHTHVVTSSWKNCWNSSASASGSRTIFKDSSTMRDGTSSLIILWTSWSDLHENFTTNVSLDKDTFDKFWNSSGSDSELRTLRTSVLIVRST